MREIKTFKKGGLDNDSSLDDVNGQDYLAAYNIRVTGTGEEEDADVSNIEGTNLIASTLNDGLNKCIGAAGFPTIRKGYAFIYNSNQFWQLKEFDFDTQVETVIFTNKTNSGNVSIFDLDPQFYINDIKLIQDRYLCFTDNNSQPHYLDLVRLKNGSYGTIVREDFSLIKGQPIKEPKAVYSNDSSRSVNLLKNRLFQFIEQFEKLDHELTAWSTRSKRVVPTDEPTPAIGTNVTISNNLIVSVDAGTNRDFKINVGARYDLLDWFIIKSIERSTVIALPNTQVNVANQIYEAYDPATNIYSFAFYNDGLYNNISVLETDLPYDYVPNKVGSLEVINGSILALADLTEGYDRPTANVNVSVSAYNPNISNPPTEPNPWVGYIADHYRVSNRSYYRVVLQFGGLPKTGDKLLIQTRSQVDSDASPVNYNITVLSTENNNLQAVLNRLGTIIPNSAVGTGDGVFVFETQGYNRYDISLLSFDLANAGTGASKSISSIKTNSSYQLALAWYDVDGKYFPILSDERFVVKTQSYALTHGLIPQINWDLRNSVPPVGAVSYQWLISENNTHARWLDINGAYDDGRSDADYLVFNIKSLFNFNETNTSSILNYEYSEGDRVTLYFTFQDVNTPIKWFDSPAIDVEVVGFETLVDNSIPAAPVTNQYLKIRKSSSLDVTDINGKGVLMEIYSPKKRVITNSDGTTTATSTLFYEIGERFDIVNGEYSVKQGIITQADSYFKTRNLTGVLNPNVPYVFQLEDPNFSDFYKSNYYSFGRARIYDDEQGRVNKKASIRYSDTFITGSKVNGITRFYGERIYGDGAGETSSNYGAIGKIRMRDNYLVCLQELKVGHIPVNMSIVEDQVEQRQYAISDKLLNFVRYLPGNFGIGMAKESYAESQNGTIYFADPNNSLPIRDGYDGLRVIPAKMTKYFRRVLKQAKADGLKIIGWYDNFNDEYNLSIESRNGVVTNLNFNDAEYIDSYPLNPGTAFTIVTNTNGTTVNNGDGTATFTPTTDVVGNGGFSFSFNSGGTVTKNTCITIIAGSTSINPFFFVDIVDQELSTLISSNSVLIIGNTIPSPISIVGGQYQINGGAWTSASGFVNSGDSVIVRQTSSASYETSTTATLTVGSYSDGFDVKTKKDITPTPFTFVDVTDADLSTLYVSNSVTIGGLSSDAPISITTGEYRKNGGSWTSADGTVVNGDTVEVRRTSSSIYSTTLGTTLTVGTYSDTYGITTKADNDYFLSLVSKSTGVGTTYGVFGSLDDRDGNPVTVTSSIGFDYSFTSSVTGAVTGSSSLPSGTSEVEVYTYDNTTESVSDLNTSNASPSIVDGKNIITTE